MLSDFNNFPDQDKKEFQVSEKDRFVLSFIIFGFIDIIAAILDTCFYIGSIVFMVILIKWA